VKKFDTKEYIEFGIWCLKDTGILVAIALLILFLLVVPYWLFV
jgi:hypothetical protein